MSTVETAATEEGGDGGKGRWRRHRPIVYTDENGEMSAPGELGD